MEAHHLHEHLVAVGCSVERACSGRMVAVTFGLEQGVTANLPLGEELADASFFLVGNAAGHGARGHKNRGEMSKGERADQQARYDLVAHAEAESAVEHTVRERDPCGHGNDVA